MAHTNNIYDLLKHSIYFQQKIQNTIARIVTCTSHFSHIKLILKSLHW